MKSNLKELMEIYMGLGRLVFEIMNEGIYEANAKVELKNFLDVAIKCGISPNDIVDLGAVSKSVLGNLMTGGNPRLHNFILISNDLRTLVGNKLIEAGVLMSVSRELQGAVWVNISNFTHKGKIYELILALQEFNDNFRSSNLGDEFDQNTREELIIILEQTISQLKCGVVEMSLFQGSAKKIGEVATWSGGRMFGKALERLGEVAVRLMTGL